MSDPFSELRAKLKRDSSESDARLYQFINQTLTPERLQEDWELIRSSANVHSGSSRKWVDIWNEFLSSLWFARISQKLTLAASLVAVAFIGWMILRPSVISMQTPTGWQMVGISLPRNLRLEGGDRLVLNGQGFELASNLGTGRRGAIDDLRVYDIHFEWRSTNGEPIIFDGAMVVTNLPGSPAKLSKRHIQGALLTGDVRIGDRPAKPLQQPFLP